ncbi:MAG: hypothetical protein NC177_05710 [Ruminococcus flavefaciens]|nr:hypothetical protein [Ruminococcus flavefaciens]
MGKNLNNGNLVTRPKKLAFYEVYRNVFYRMEGFTDLGYSQNPKEYSRQYVDEEFERTDIVGYAPSISYSFDRYTGNEVLSDIVKITENECIGDLMKRRIVTVDLSGVGDGSGNAKMREYAVIPDTNGDTTDCMTYSGNFKARGVLVDCIATSDDDWQTVKVTEKVDYSTSAYIAVTGDKIVGSISNVDGGLNISGEVEKNSKVTFTVKPMFDGAKVTLYQMTDNYPRKIASDFGKLNNTNNLIISDTRYCITVEAGENQSTYFIDLTAVESLQTASTVSATSAKSKTTAKE